MTVAQSIRMLQILRSISLPEIYLWTDLEQLKPRQISAIENRLIQGTDLQEHTTLSMLYSDSLTR